MKKIMLNLNTGKKVTQIKMRQKCQQHVYNKSCIGGVIIST